MGLVSLVVGLVVMVGVVVTDSPIVISLKTQLLDKKLKCYGEQIFIDDI